MLPPRCSHPACMNMEVKSVGKSPAGFARKRRGTKAHFSIKGSPPLNSTKKNRRFSAIRAYVTTGTVLSAELSSPIGNISFTSVHSGWICRNLTSLDLEFFKKVNYSRPALICTIEFKNLDLYAFRAKLLSSGSFSKSRTIHFNEGIYLRRQGWRGYACDRSAFGNVTSYMGFMVLPVLLLIPILISA